MAKEFLDKLKPRNARNPSTRTSVQTALKLHLLLPLQGDDRAAAEGVKTLPELDSTDYKKTPAVSFLPRIAKPKQEQLKKSCSLRIETQAERDAPSDRKRQRAAISISIRFPSELRKAFLSASDKPNRTPHRWSSRNYIIKIYPAPSTRTVHGQDPPPARSVNIETLVMGKQASSAA